LYEQRKKKDEKLFYTLGTVSDGVWYSLHILAADGKRAALETMLETLSRRFVCPKCILHLREYIAKNPRPTGTDPKHLFDWTVAFHNSVNARTSGRIMTDEAADILFYQLTEGADRALVKLRESNGVVEKCEGCEKEPRKDTQTAVSFVR
jgi:hypothetical protein